MADRLDEIWIGPSMTTRLANQGCSIGSSELLPGDGQRRWGHTIEDACVVPLAAMQCEMSNDVSVKSIRPTPPRYSQMYVTARQSGNLAGDEKNPTRKQRIKKTPIQISAQPAS